MVLEQYNMYHQWQQWCPERCSKGQFKVIRVITRKIFRFSFQAFQGQSIPVRVSVRSVFTENFLSQLGRPIQTHLGLKPVCFHAIHAKPNSVKLFTDWHQIITEIENQTLSKVCCLDSLALASSHWTYLYFIRSDEIGLATILNSWLRSIALASLISEFFKTHQLIIDIIIDC